MPPFPFLCGQACVEIPIGRRPVPAATRDDLEHRPSPWFEWSGFGKGPIVGDLEDAEVLGWVRLNTSDVEPFRDVS